MEHVVVSRISDDGTLNAFEIDQLVTDTPTLYMLLEPTVKSFLLEEIFYWMNPTAVETYQLFLFEGPEADDVLSRSKLVYESAAARADSTAYLVVRDGAVLPRIVNLDEPGKLYYALDWTGAPGNTPGHLVVKGREMRRRY